MLPYAIMIGLPIRQQRRQTPRQRIALPTRPLQSALPITHQRMPSITNIVLLTLLNDSHPTKRLRQPLAHVRRIARLAIHPLALQQPAELDHVRRQDALGAALHQLRPRLREVQPIGVQHKGDAALARLLDHARARVLHRLVAPETRADDDDVQPAEHRDDFA